MYYSCWYNQEQCQNRVEQHQLFIDHWASLYLGLKNSGQQSLKKKIKINSWNILLQFFCHLFNFRCTFVLRHAKSNSPFTLQNGPCDPTYSYLFPFLIQTICLFLLCFKILPNNLTFLPLHLNMPLFSCSK